VHFVSGGSEQLGSFTFNNSIAYRGNFTFVAAQLLPTAATSLRNLSYVVYVADKQPGPLWLIGILTPFIVCFLMAVGVGVWWKCCQRNPQVGAETVVIANNCY
jgi:hypothetical protein